LTGPANWSKKSSPQGQMQREPNNSPSLTPGPILLRECDAHHQAFYPRLLCAECT
jgi:hypothetical protein